MTATSLPGVLAERAASVPDRVFLRDVGGCALTYQQTLERAGLWASALSKAGVVPGDRVATMIPNSVEGVVIWLGISLLGAIEVPIHGGFVGYMLEHTLNTAGAAVVVVGPRRLGGVVDSSERLESVRTVVTLEDEPTRTLGTPIRIVRSRDLLNECGATFPAREMPSRWDAAAILFTSGTTGPSKGVVIPWGQVEATAVRTFPFDDLTEHEVLYVFTPSAHMGAKALPYLAALLGGQAVLRPDFKIHEFLRDVRDFGITTAPIIGSIPHFLDQSPEQPDDAAIPLRNVVMAPLIPDLDGFARRFGVRICTAYNMTELSIPFASEGWDVTNHASVGRLLGGWPDVEVRLVDEHDMEVPVGEVGELVVRSGQPWTMNQGYLGLPDATTSAWRNGWFHTGDAFRGDADGYYYFVDRLKDAIRRRGENISSFEVETVVNQHPAVAESAAVPVPAETADDEIKIVVVPRPGESLDPRSLIDFLSGRLPRFMIPRFVEVVESLPKTEGTMRVQKQSLRAAGITTATWDSQRP